jgi:DNA-binding transcriptional LysR family regulator
LRALEKELGIAIVKRGRVYAGLTPEGEHVLASAQRMLQEHALLQQELASSAERPQGSLQLGVVPTAVPVAARFASMLQARYPGIRPVLRSMSAQAIEEGIENLSLDLALGFTERLKSRRANAARLAVLPQYNEHYFLVRRASTPRAKADASLRIGAPMAWRDAAALPLCLLTPEMHNRSVVDGAFAEVGASVRPVIETNSILALALSVLAGDVSSVLPGALVDAMPSSGELEALPLVSPERRTPVGFIYLAESRASSVMNAALALAADPHWLAHAAQHSGALRV